MQKSSETVSDNARLGSGTDVYRTPEEMILGFWIWDGAPWEAWHFEEGKYTSRSLAKECITKEAVLVSSYYLDTDKKVFILNNPNGTNETAVFSNGDLLIDNCKCRRITSFEDQLRFIEAWHAKNSWSCFPTVDDVDTKMCVAAREWLNKHWTPAAGDNCIDSSGRIIIYQDSFKLFKTKNDFSWLPSLEQRVELVGFVGGGVGGLKININHDDEVLIYVDCDSFSFKAENIKTALLLAIMKLNGFLWSSKNDEWVNCEVK